MEENYRTYFLHKDFRNLVDTILDLIIGKKFTFSEIRNAVSLAEDKIRRIKNVEQREKGK